MFRENERDILASFVEEEIVTILNRQDRDDPLMRQYRRTLAEILAKLKEGEQNFFRHRFSEFNGIMRSSLAGR